MIGDVLATTLSLAGEGDYIGGLARAAGGHAVFDRAIEGSNRRLALFGAASGAVAVGLGAGIVKAVGAAGRMEQIEIGFKGVLGSAEAARLKIEELQEFAARTPFNFTDLARGSQLLLGTGTSADQLIPILGALGNGMSAAGRGTEDFNGALLQISQIINSGKLQGDEMRILAERGLPVKEIMDELGTSMGQVGKAGITADRFIAALIKTMNSGRFAGAMEAQSKTLVGSLSNLQDAGERLLITFGKPLIDPTVAVTKGITDLGTALGKIPPPLASVIAHGAVLGVVGLGAAAVVSAVKLGRMAAENVKLQNTALTAGGGAGTQTTAEARLATQLGLTSTATRNLTLLTLGLEKAHYGAARAAGVQAGGAARVGVGGVPIPGMAGRGASAAGTAGTGRGALPTPSWMVGTAGAGAGAVGVGAAVARGGTISRPVGEMRGQFGAGKLAAGHAKMSADVGAAAGAAAVATGAARFAKFAKFGGPAALAAGIGGEIALSQLPDSKEKGIAQGAFGGAMIGGTIGSFIAPGAGTAIGAGIGAVAGGGAAILGQQGEMQATEKAKKEEAKITESAEVVALLKEQVTLLAEIRRAGGVVSTKAVPGSWQQQALDNSRMIG